MAAQRAIRDLFNNVTDARLPVSERGRSSFDPFPLMLGDIADLCEIGLEVVAFPRSTYVGRFLSRISAKHQWTNTLRSPFGCGRRPR